MIGQLLCFNLSEVVCFCTALIGKVAAELWGKHLKGSELAFGGCFPWKLPVPRDC